MMNADYFISSPTKQRYTRISQEEERLYKEDLAAESEDSNDDSGGDDDDDGEEEDGDGDEDEDDSVKQLVGVSGVCEAQCQKASIFVVAKQQVVWRFIRTPRATCSALSPPCQDEDEEQQAAAAKSNSRKGKSQKKAAFNPFDDVDEEAAGGGDDGGGGGDDYNPFADFMEGVSTCCVYSGVDAEASQFFLSSTGAGCWPSPL